MRSLYSTWTETIRDASQDWDTIVVISRSTRFWERIPSIELKIEGAEKVIDDGIKQRIHMFPKKKWATDTFASTEEHGPAAVKVIESTQKKQ